MESLEGRRLLAADVVPTPYHNPLIAQDVNYDFNVSPADALMVINEINRHGSRNLGTDFVDPQTKLFVDVNGDGSISPADVLGIVNYLNGEGETSPLVTYTSEITDLSGAPISQVVVGQSFRLNVFVQDTRPSGPTGVFQNAIDVGIEGFERVTFPVGGGSFLSSLTFGSSDPTVVDEYDSFTRGSRGADGTETEEFFNEIGATWSDFFNAPQPEGDIYPFFQAELRADEAGEVRFVLNQHEDEPTSQVNVYDPSIPPTLPDNGRIDPSMISYGSASITVISDPTAPVAMDDMVPTDEDESVLLVGGDVDLTANDQVEPGRTLSVVSVDAIAGTTAGTLDGFTYTPPANFFGSDTVTYVVEDSVGLRSSATVTLSIAPVNDPPTAVDDNLSADEESSDNILDVLLNDSAGPLETGDTLTITAVGTPDNGGTVSISTDGQTLVYTPDATFLGTETFTYTITDSGGLTDTATVTVEVEPTVLPRARTDRPTVAEDSTDNVIDVLANDRANAGASVFLVNIASMPTNGSATIDDNGTPADATDDTVLYTPDANFSGTDTFTYTMNDTAAGSVASVGTVVVTVSEVNDPVILVDDTATATEDTVAMIPIASLLANDSPGDGEAGQQTLTITSVAAVGAGGTVAIDGSNIVYTPAADFNGQFLFTYTAEDNGVPVSSATATVTVTVSAVNDDPIAANDTVSAQEDTAQTIQASVLLANDVAGPANESDQTLSITSVSPASSQGGTVSIAAGVITYTPATDFNGNDTFTYTLSDGEGGTDTGTVTVNVAALNDAPIVVADNVRAFKEIPLTITSAELLANDSPGPADEAGQTLSIVAVAATSDTNGTVVLNADGTITYTPAADYTGPASFSYTVQDSGPSGNGNVNTATGTVNVTVEEFVPSTISGVVWVDETNDGIIDDAERRLGSIIVTVSGTSLGQTIEPMTLVTLADGSYSVENLGPGTYVVNYQLPGFLLDGKDMANGVLDTSDAVENQFTIDIAQPGGIAAENYNFGVIGMQSSRARILDQLASSYTHANPSLAFNGAYFSLGSDNHQNWSALLDGFDHAEFTEAVLSDDGEHLLLSIVDDAEDIHTAVLDSDQFVSFRDSSGDVLVRVLGAASDFSWTQVQLGTPAIVAANKYLDAVDTVFDQEDWGDA